MAFKTEHFKFYRVEVGHQPASVSLTLQGQFDKTARRHKISLLMGFGNPVRKNNEPLKNPRTHLSWYSLTGAAEPLRTVEVFNQFKDDKLVIESPQFLLAPAIKQEGDKPTPVPLPKDVSHFKVYRVLKHNFTPRIVSLQDQFDQESSKYEVDGPAYFAVPVDKTVGKKTFPKVNPKEHLVIYPIRELQPRPVQQVRPVFDQFGGGLLQRFRPYFLAVPTEKRSWTEGA